MTEYIEPENVIKKLIIERGIRQSFICKKTGMLPQQFSLCMRGKRKLRVWEFIAICNILNLDFSEFNSCLQNTD